MLIDPGPVDGEDEFVLGILPDETEQHEGQCDVLRVHAGLGRNILDRDLQEQTNLLESTWFLNH